MARLTAIVVEDQPLSRGHIASMLQQLGVEVLAACANGREAVEWIPALSPDIVFLDVQMPELNGFDVIEAIGVDVMPRVVFITAYDSYALKAFEVHACGYLLKPVALGRLAQVIERIHSGGPVKSPAKRAREMAGLLADPAARPHVDRLVVRRGGRVVFIRNADIEWIEACGNYAIIHAAGQRYYTRQPMLALERRLEHMLARIHRSTLVNLAFVVELRTAPHSEYDVVMRSGKLLRVTRRFRPALEQRLRSMP